MYDINLIWPLSISHQIELFHKHIIHRFGSGGEGECEGDKIKGLFMGSIFLKPTILLSRFFY